MQAMDKEEKEKYIDFWRGEHKQIAGGMYLQIRR